jgi:hypothetical protein
MRTGPKNVMMQAAFGGALLAMIEGVGIMLTKMLAPPPPGGLMFDAALARWKHIGGASWCTLAAYLLLVAATLRSSRSLPPQNPVTSQP